jgi:hypothetical protein
MAVKQKWCPYGERGGVLIEFSLAIGILVLIVGYTVELGSRYKQQLILSGAAHYAATSSAANPALPLPCNDPKGTFCIRPKFNQNGDLVSEGNANSLRCFAEIEAYRFLNAKENRAHLKPDSYDIVSLVKTGSEVSGYAPRILEIRIEKKPDERSCILCFGSTLLSKKAIGHSVIGVQRVCQS